MRKTNFLMILLSLLLLALAALLYYKNYDENNKAINNLINIFRTKKVIIPKENYNQLNYDFKTVKQTNNFVPQNMNDIKNIYYTVLNNGWNEFTFYCPDEYKSCINDVVAFANDKEELSLLNNYVNPYNSYSKFNTLIIGDDEIYLSIEKLYNEEEKIYIDEKVNTIINTLKLNTGKITISDIKNIHNYILKNTTYDDNYKDGDETISNKAYGLLTNKRALCSGYSDTFAIILNKLNIPNFKVNSEDHVWNVIFFDSKWSHVDVTWDDDEINSNNTYNFFMINTKELLKKDKLKHNFNEKLYIELQ